MRRHLEGAEFDQSQAAGRAIGRIQFVDGKFRAVRVAGQVHQQIAQQAIDHPGLVAGLQGRQHGVHLLECNRQLVQVVVARLVDPRRLAGWPDEGSRKQVRQRRMILPIGDQAFEQVRAAQHRAVLGGRTAQRGVVAAAGTRMPAIDHEFFRSQARQARLLVQRRHVVNQLVPARRRVDIHLDHARVRRDAEQLDARVARRRIALDPDLELELGGGVFDAGDQRQIVLDTLERRHENMQPPVPNLNAQGGMDDLKRLWIGVQRAVLLRRLTRSAAGTGRFWLDPRRGQGGAWRERIDIEIVGLLVRLHPG